MNFDAFEEDGQVAIQQQQYTPNHFQTQDNAPDDQFNFSEPVNYASIQNLQQNVYPSVQPDSQALLKIQQQQMRIQEALREKSNREFQDKKKRKQEGRRQYEQFMAKKQKETATRRQQNIQKQKALIEKNSKQAKQTGWKKVAENVALKQGQHKGQKDINRMRESIINKKNDQLN